MCGAGAVEAVCDAKEFGSLRYTFMKHSLITERDFALAHDSAFVNKHEITTERHNVLLHVIKRKTSIDTRQVTDDRYTQSGRMYSESVLSDFCYLRRSMKVERTLIR